MAHDRRFWTDRLPADVGLEAEGRRTTRQFWGCEGRLRYEGHAKDRHADVVFWPSSVRTTGYRLATDNGGTVSPFLVVSSNGPRNSVCVSRGVYNLMTTLRM